ncbi:hypothetical protein THAOC_25179, partial [Thalassiosira oceanica]
IAVHRREDVAREDPVAELAGWVHPRDLRAPVAVETVLPKDRPFSNEE